MNNFCFLGESNGLEGECLSFHSLTTTGSQKASRLGRRPGALGIARFFLDGDTSLEGLWGAEGVLGREMGGALRGDRCLVGVGELVKVGRSVRVNIQIDDF